MVVPHRIGRAAGIEPQLRGVLGSVIREGVPLQVFPDSFDRVQLGGIGGEELRADLVLTIEEFTEEDRAVDVEPVPDQHEGMPEMPPEIAEEGDQARGGHVLVRQEGKVKSHSPAMWGHRDRRHRGDLLVGTCALVEDRSLSHRSPGASEVGSHQKPALIQEDEGGSQACGVFFILGHSSFTQRWISASSRSRARLSGFWGLKPKAWRRRAT